MNTIKYTPIGIIHTPFHNTAETPPQPQIATGTIEILPELAEGLSDLDGFSHIVLIYHLHLSKNYSLKTVPREGHHLKGVFATRSPHRPNPIGMSVVQLDRIENTTLYISNLDIIDGTPLLDIKPYISSLDRQHDVRTGWLEDK